jgi:hypothetical protein
MGAFNFILSPKVLNPLLSIFDREAREVIHRITAKIPEDSFMRSEAFGRAFDVFRGILEGLKLGPFSTLVEKLTDYGDSFAESLTGKSKEKEAKTEAVLQGWMNKFFADAGGRLEKATDPIAELEKIKKEFAARMELLGLIEATIKKVADEKKAAEKKPPSIEGPPLEVGKKIDGLIDTWKTRAQRRGYTERRKS